MMIPHRKQKNKGIHPITNDNQAQTLLNDGKPDEAYTASNEMLDYGDSAEKLPAINHKRAEGSPNAGKWYADILHPLAPCGAFFVPASDARIKECIAAMQNVIHLPCLPFICFIESRL